ncbi:MAG: hypothetical protein R3A47_03220 [Polyangiales bacterium]
MGRSDRALRRFVSQLRQHLPSTGKKIYFVFGEPASTEQRSLWSGYLSGLADPYLALATDD